MNTKIRQLIENQFLSYNDIAGYMKNSNDEKEFRELINQFLKSKNELIRALETVEGLRD